MDTFPERGVFFELMAVVIHSVLHAKIKPGDSVVVNGSCPIGLLAIRQANIVGAYKGIAIGRRIRLRMSLV